MSKPPRAVIDQPGLKIIVSGLIIALFLGLGLKSQITSNKVSVFVRKGLDSLNSNLNVDFENAEIKLSDWGIPKPYILINQMRIKKQGIDCGQNQAYIEKLIVPLTLDLLFDPQAAEVSLRFNRVEIRIGNTAGCPNQTAAAVNPPPTSTEAIKQDVHTVKPIAQKDDHQLQAERLNEVKSLLQGIRQKLSTRLNNVRIDLVKVIYEDGFHKNFELRNAAIQFEYQQSKLASVTLQSQLVSLYEPYSNSFKLRSEIISEFKFSDNRLQGQLSLKGKIIDREFTAEAMADSETGLFKFSSQLKNMPIKTLTELTRPAEVGVAANKTFEDSKAQKGSSDISVNFNLTGEVIAEYHLYKQKWQVASLNNAVIKSADSSIELNHFDYLKWQDDERYKVQLVIVQLDLNNLYRLFGWSDTKKTIDSLGVFSGTFEINNNIDAQLNGILRNMTIVFSTKNKVKLQKISSMNVKTVLAKGLFQLKLSDITIENHRILGLIEARVPFNYAEKKLELEPKNLVFNASLKGKILSPEIEQHMFSHEQDFDLNLKLVNLGSAKQVQLTAEEFKFSSLQFKKINFFIELDPYYKPLGYRLQAKSLTINESATEGSENDYVNFMETYLKEQKTNWPVVIPNFEMKYLIGLQKSDGNKSLPGLSEQTQYDSFSMTINGFSSPRNFVYFKQTGRQNSTSVWQIDNLLKTTEGPAVSSQFVLNPGQGTFEKVE